MLTGLRHWFERRATMRELRVLEAADKELLVQQVRERLTDIKQAIGSRDIARAGQAWDDLLAQHPREAKEPRGTLQLLLDMKRFDEAEALADERRKRAPHQAYDEDYAHVAQERGDFAEAARRWGAVRKRYASWLAYSSGAVALAASGLTEEAEKILVAGIKQFPDRINIRIEMARFTTRGGNLPEALRQWQAIRDKYAHLTGFEGMVFCLRELGRFDEEFEVLSEAIARFPSDSGFRAGMVVALRRRKDSTVQALS